MNTQSPGQIVFRRLGDILQGLAVLAIAGLVVAVIDLRITVKSHATKAEVAELTATAIKISEALKAQQQIINLQITQLSEQAKLLRQMISRLSEGGFNAKQGADLTLRVITNEEDISKNREAITHLQTGPGNPAHLAQTDAMANQLNYLRDRIRDIEQENDRLRAMIPGWLESQKGN